MASADDLTEVMVAAITDATNGQKPYLPLADGEQVCGGLIYIYFNIYTYYYHYSYYLTTSTTTATTVTATNVTSH